MKFFDFPDGRFLRHEDAWSDTIGVPFHPVFWVPPLTVPAFFVNLATYTSGTAVIHTRQFMEFSVLEPVNTFMNYGIVPTAKVAHKVYVWVEEYSFTLHRHWFVNVFVRVIILNIAVIKNHRTEGGCICRRSLF